MLTHCDVIRIKFSGQTSLLSFRMTSPTSYRIAGCLHETSSRRLKSNWSLGQLIISSLSLSSSNAPIPRHKAANLWHIKSMWLSSTLTSDPGQKCESLLRWLLSLHSPDSNSLYVFLKVLVVKFLLCISQTLSLVQGLFTFYSDYWKLAYLSTCSYDSCSAR